MEGDCGGDEPSAAAVEEKFLNGRSGMFGGKKYDGARADLDRPHAR